MIIDRSTYAAWVAYRNNLKASDYDKVPPVILPRGTAVTCNGYDATIVDHNRGPQYNIRVPGGVVCSAFNIVPPTVSEHEVFFLTDGCCEKLAQVSESSMISTGLTFIATGTTGSDWHPLTEQEQALIAEEGVEIAENVYAYLPYSVLLDNRKWLAVQFSTVYDHDEQAAIELDDFIARGIASAAINVGGVILRTHDRYIHAGNGAIRGEYSTFLLVPVDMALSKACDLDEWKLFLEQLLCPAFQKRNEKPVSGIHSC